VFLQFKEEAIKAWLDRDAVKRRDEALQKGFDFWKVDHESSNRKYFGLPFYMLHSLSHLLLTAISLECGYPPSSLRERVYAWQPTGQYGILIYTGSPDAIAGTRSTAPAFDRLFDLFDTSNHSVSKGNFTNVVRRNERRASNPNRCVSVTFPSGRSFGR
jgi:hypothetical protein